MLNKDCENREKNWRKLGVKFLEIVSKTCKNLL